MLDSKKFNYIILSLIIFSLPILEFLKDNLNEIGIIIGKSFFILIFFIFSFLIIVAFLLNLFFKNIEFYESLLITSVGFWILFKHSSINLFLLKLKKNFGFMEVFSAEISLILIIIIFLIFFIFFFKGNIFLKKFIFIFFYLNLFVLSYQLSFNKSHSINKDNFQNKKILYPDLINKKKPNIYFFILDAMQPIKEFEQYYKIELSNFLDEIKYKNYVYLNNTINLYDNTTHGLSAFFNLDGIISDDGKMKIKSSSYFPLVLKENGNSNLLNNLNNLGYDFKWAGNYFAYCPKFNLKYCLNKNHNAVDLYLKLSFLAKSPLIQLTQKLGESLNFNFRNYIFMRSLDGGGIFKLHNGMGRLTKYLNEIEDINKPTFYFIHHMSPHHPYITASDCSYKNYPGTKNYEGYKAAYLCNIKKISETINFLEKKDPDSFVIFQSDHSWEMAKTPLEKKTIFNLFKVRNECEYDLEKNLNNINMLRLVLSCITGNNPNFIEN